MSGIFVSYSSKNAKVAREIAQRLEGQGHEVWMDQLRLLGGENYVEKVSKGIGGADVFMPLLSPSSVQSPWVWREICFAAEKNKTIVPVVIEFTKLPQKIAFVLAGIHCVDFQISKDPWEDLSRALKTERGQEAYRGVKEKAHRRFRSLQLRFRAALSSPFVLVGIALLIAWFLIPRLPSPNDILTPGASAASNEVLKVAYTAPLDSASAPVAAVTALYGPRSGDDWRPLESGQNLSSDDRYCIAIHPKEQAWCYVFQIDASGQLFCLFPKTPDAPFSTGRNPLPPGQWTLVPDDDQALYLDETLGIEHLYVAVAGAPWRELEQALAQTTADHASTGAVLSVFTTPSRGVAGKENATPPADILITGDSVLHTVFTQGVKGALIREFHFSHVQLGHTGSER